MCLLHCQSSLQSQELGDSPESMAERARDFGGWMGSFIANVPRLYTMAATSLKEEYLDPIGAYVAVKDPTTKALTDVHRNHSRDPDKVFQNMRQATRLNF